MLPRVLAAEASSVPSCPAVGGCLGSSACAPGLQASLTGFSGLFPSSSELGDGGGGAPLGPGRGVPGKEAVRIHALLRGRVKRSLEASRARAGEEDEEDEEEEEEEDGARRDGERV